MNAMIGYVDTPEEIVKNPHGKSDLMEIAAGNEDAFRFLWVFWNFTHLYDDLVDKDKPVTVEQAAKWVVHFLEEVSFNPFYLANVQSLMPFMVQVCNRWCDGDAMEADGVPAASAVKCGDVDLFFHVAYLVGGWDHVRRVKHTRRYDPIDRKG